MSDIAADFGKYQRGYGNLWRAARLRPESQQRVLSTASNITDASAMEHYNTASAITGIPAGLIAALNYRESGARFDAYLGNGQPLNRVTTLVPAGRGPFTSWELGAEDALSGTPRPPDGRWTIEFALYFAERYNGRGYMKHGENSPYVWSETSLEQRGMFVRDGQFDPSADDTRPGVAALFLAFAQVRPSLSLPTLTTTTETTTMAPLPAPASNPFPAILQGLTLAKTFTPFVAQLLPPPANIIVSLAIPAIEDFSKFVDAAHRDGIDKGDVADLMDALATRLHTAAAALRPQTT